MIPEDAVTFAQLQQHYLAPHLLYARLRNHSPIYFDATSRCWLVTSRLAVTRILRDPRFESRLEQSPPPATLQGTPGTFPPVRTLLGQQLLFYTGNAHRKAYAIVQKALAALEKDEQMRKFIVDVVDKVLAEALARGEMDVPKHLAVPVSGYISARVVGLPTDNWAQLERWIGWSNAFADRTSGYGRSSTGHIYSMQVDFLRLLEERHCRQQAQTTTAEAAPARVSDLLDALLAAPVYFPTDQVIASNCQMIFSAGRITAEKAVSEGIKYLAQYRLWPQVREAIIADTSGVACQRLADEWLRFVTPTRYIARYATQDVRFSEFAGEPLIRRGQRVILYLEAANRDPGAFDNADGFESQRLPNPHVAFGFGEHTCPGAGLARLETAVVIEELARLVTHLEPTEGTEAVYRANPNLGGLESYSVWVDG